MPFLHRRVFLISLIGACLLVACSLPAPVTAPTPGSGDYGATIAALQTRAVETASAQGFGPTLTPTPPSTVVLPQTGGGQSPAVIKPAQCWRGPGPGFDLIATLQPGTAVSLLGRGVIAGWFILRNPANGDPCWLQASNLQIPANVDISALPVYNPPWTPTITPVPATPGGPTLTSTP